MEIVFVEYHYLGILACFASKKKCADTVIMCKADSIIPLKNEESLQ